MQIKRMDVLKSFGTPEYDPIPGANELAEQLGVSVDDVLPVFYRHKIRWDDLGIIRMWRPKRKRMLIRTKQFKAKRNR